MAASAPNVDVFLGDDEVPDADFVSYIVERDMYQPDMAVVVLSNQSDKYTPKLKVGAPLKIKVGGPELKEIFDGECMGFEPMFRGGETTKISIRAVNKMHRLLRKRESLTFQDKTDQQILQQVVQSAGLTLEWKHAESITYKHVYQHNLNGLEFVRMRAARLGCHVWCVGNKIMVKEPDLANDSGVELSVDKGGELRSFTPRVQTGSVVKKVTVKGWNPETKELITGQAEVQNSPLGSQSAVAACGDLASNAETFTVDQPVHSKQEADAMAKARLRDLNMQFVTGEAECSGNADLDLGQVVKITANAMTGDDVFNGKYYVMGITHRHTLPKSKEGGFVTVLKLARDAWKP
jgi:phage protein D